MRQLSGVLTTESLRPGAEPAVPLTVTSIQRIEPTGTTAAQPAAGLDGPD